MSIATPVEHTPSHPSPSDPKKIGIRYLTVIEYGDNADCVFLCRPSGRSVVESGCMGCHGFPLRIAGQRKSSGELLPCHADAGPFSKDETTERRMRRHA